MYFLNNETNDTEARKQLQFITASDESGFLHLYYYNISLESKDLVQMSNGKVHLFHFVSLFFLI